MKLPGIRLLTRAVKDQSVYQWSILVLLIIASVIYLMQLDSLHKQSMRISSERSQFILEKTRTTISVLIRDVRRDVVLLAGSHKDEIQALIQDPENYSMYEALLGDIKALYPEVFTVTIADGSGNPVMEDYEGFVQQMCIDDISHYSSTEQHPALYIHPNPFLYHFDLMSKMRIDDSDYIVSMSFDVSLLAETLRNMTIPGYELYLINVEDDDLIEATIDGSRDTLSGLNHLSQEQLDATIGMIDIPGTRWRLQLIEREEDLISSYNEVSYKHIWPIFVLIMICLASLIYLQFMQRRIEGQEKLIQDKNKALGFSHEHLTALFSSVMDGMVTIDKHNVIIAFNPAAETMFGYKAEEVIGKDIGFLLPATFNENFDDFISTYLDEDRSSAVENIRNMNCVRNDGEEFPTEISISIVRYGKTLEFVWLIRDITYRIQVEKMKSEFISTISHEMRTPLTSIRGSLGLIENEVVGDVNPKIKEMISVALNNTKRMIKMINEILDIDRIESGNMLFHFENVSLEQLALDSIHNIKGFADENSINIEFHCLCEDTTLRADGDRLIQVITNLLSNAIKFSHADSRVLVLIDCNDDHISLSIKDTGIGIPEDEQAYIFEKFSQVDSSDTRDIGGSGLGLSIVKSILQAHNANISLESKAGKGSTFIILFPRLKHAII